MLLSSIFRGTARRTAPRHLHANTLILMKVLVISTCAPAATMQTLQRAFVMTSLRPLCLPQHTSKSTDPGYLQFRRVHRQPARGGLDATRCRQRPGLRRAGYAVPGHRQLRFHAVFAYRPFTIRSAGAFGQPGVTSPVMRLLPILHGVMTYWLLQGLQGKAADLNHDGHVTALEAFAYAKAGRRPELEQRFRGHLPRLHVRAACVRRARRFRAVLSRILVERERGCALLSVSPPPAGIPPPGRSQVSSRPTAAY